MRLDRDGSYTSVAEIPKLISLNKPFSCTSVPLLYDLDMNF